MLNAIQMGILTSSTKERLEQLEAQRDELNTAILQAQLVRPKYTKEQIISWISRFKHGHPDDPEYRRQIVDTFVNAVYVYDDRLVFTYNFKDGTETITKKEIEDAFSSDLSESAPPIRENRLIYGSLFSFKETIEHTRHARWFFLGIWCLSMN